ncbi:MAG: PTS sugar transporter subunit IIC, partial [Oscillospiraceae bacterium]|nr:PTS sugar transporter subunit IIC [Oscillospiraceae bacterium]
CGLCGPIGVWTGWYAPSEQAIANGASAIAPTGFDWLGLALVCVVLPALLSWIFGWILRRIGWIKPGDLKL